MAEDQRLLDYLKRVTVDLHDTRQRLREVESQAQIAIVGMGCRYPGGVRIAAGPVGAGGRRSDAIGEFPADRGWDLEGLYDPDPDHLGTCCTREAGFSTTPASSTRGSSGSARARRWRWTRSSGCCWRPRWEAFERAGIDPAHPARLPDRRVRGHEQPGLRHGAARRGTAGRRGLRGRPGTRPASCRAGCRTCWGWRARR